DTLLYVLREMTDAEGGFYSAEDADSIPPEHAGEPGAHKAEGAFYLWSEDEINRLLGSEAEVFKLRFGIESRGNAPIDPQQEFVGKNLLYVARSIEDIAQRVGKTPSDVVDTLNAARVRLFEARVGRARPHLDDKVLTAWNGLMIAALARGARLLISEDMNETTGRVLNAARRAPPFLRA